MKRYMNIWNQIGKMMAPCLLVLCLFTSCSMIDDDLDNCTQLDYELQLITNMTTEVQTQLTAETDVSVASVLRAHLSDIFTDYAHDVDLSFYDTKGDSARLHHDEHIMDANQHSYTLYIPRQKYMHLAVANIVDDPLIDLMYDDRCYTAQVALRDLATSRGATSIPDTIDSQTTGLFTARQLMEMIEGINQTFNVKLYMANCAAALVMDPQGHSTDGIKVYTTGFATAFNIADSSYVFSNPSPIVRTKLLHRESENDNLTFCSVTFPSREPLATRTVIETEEPFIAQPDENALWELRVYVPQSDGTITETVLRVKEPLRAGQLKIIKCRIGSNGGIEVDGGSSEVSTSVTLDWKDGLEIET